MLRGSNLGLNLQLFAESTKERIERLVAEGKMPQAAVDRAVQLWEKRLKKGIFAPNKEVIKIELDDLYHLIVDRRIWRHPERLEWMIRGIYEIRTAGEGRRLALTRWPEGEKIQVGYLILEADGRVRTAHVVDARKIGRFQRQGELLWRK